MALDEPLEVSASPGGDGGWRLSAIVGRRLEPDTDGELLSALLDPAMDDQDAASALGRQLWIRQELWVRSFEDLFPGLGNVADTRPTTNARVRVRNALLRCGLRSWWDLADMTPFQLASVPSFGQRSFVETVAMMIHAWAAQCRNNRAEPMPSDESSASPAARAPGSSTDLQLAEIREVLRWLWATTGADTLTEALANWAASNPPERIHAMGEQLLGTRLDQLLDLPAADERTWRALFNLPEREMAILRGRLYPTGPPTTLDELGQRLDITRERVRQLESALRKEIARRLAADGDCAALVHLASRTSRQIGFVAETGDAIMRVDRAVQLSSEETPEDDLRRHVLLSLMGPPVERDGMLLLSGAARRLDEVRRDVTEADRDAVAWESRVDDLLAELTVPPVLEGRVEALLGVRRIGEQRVLWGGSMADKAVAVLTVSGEPMAMLAIHEGVGLECNPRSLSGQVQGDPRVMRRGKDLYGLRAWGGEEYTGILEELEQAIERAGGRVDLESTIDEFVSMFGVTAHSVRSYAADRRFVRNGDGTLSLRTGDAPARVPRARSLVETRRAFMIDGVWHLRFEADHDLLRGSGRAVPSGAATALGLEPDLTLGFDYGAGSVTFSWGRNQPTAGSLRATALAEGCSEGDLLFLPLTGPEPRPCRVSRATNLRRTSALGRLSLEMGLQGEQGEPDDPFRIAQALGLPAGADWQDIAECLRARGDGDLAELIPPQLG